MIPKLKVTVSYAAPDTAVKPGNWRLSALCANPVFDPEMWHPKGTDARSVADANQAQRICRLCPVQEKCLRWSLDNHQDQGVWGGLTEQERRRIHRRRTPTVALPKPSKTERSAA
ncbi:WhiB family transcriptional regulator [Streptomyces anulatus]|uniref:WhiB family transcriptional regulator n=1 Tax=Streptomyces anulatus TaxID=1892 RepID=UPI00099F2C18|nr:WhiB family transcriptional regulator [Streptomyces anulatus]